MFLHPPANYRGRQVQQRLKISGFLFVAHTQLAIIIHPGMRALHNPTPSSPLGSVAGFGRSLLGHVGNIATLPHLLFSSFARISLVHAQVLGSALCRLRPWHHNRVQRLGQQFHVVPVRPGDDKRQRGATAVHQQTALRPFFSPDLLGCFPPPLVPKELCPGYHPSFATPKQSLPSRHTPPSPHATSEQRIPPAATVGNNGELRWHCRNSWATPSTDSRCAARTRWRQKCRAAQWACARRRASVETCAFAARADRAVAAAVQLVTTAHRKLPKIGPSACENHGKSVKTRQLLFTDKLLAAAKA